MRKKNRIISTILTPKKGKIWYEFRQENITIRFLDGYKGRIQIEQKFPNLKFRKIKIKKIKI